MAENKLARGTIYLTIAGLAVVLSNYLINISVARFLGIELYGVFGILSSLLYINTIIVNNGGIPVATSKFIAESRYSFSYLLRSSAILQLIISLVITLFYLLFAKTISLVFLKDASLIPYIMLMGVIIVPLSFFSLYSDAVFGGLRDFKKQAFLKLLYSFLRTAFVIFFIALGLKIYGILIGFFISALICFFCALVIFNKKNYPELNLTSLKINTSYFLRFLTPLTISALAFTLTRSASVLFIKGLLMNNTLVGFYTAAYTLANISYVAFSALPITLLPSISKSTFDKNIIQTRKYISQSVRYLILLLFPLAAIVSATSKEVLAFFYPSSFQAAASVLSVLIISFTFSSLFSSLRIILIGSGKTKVEMIISLFSLGILFALSLILIPLKGIYGAALASLFSSIFSIVIISYYIIIKFKALINISSFFRITLTSILLFLIASLRHYSGVLVLINYLVLFCLYLLLLYLFGEFKKEDFKLLKSIIKLKKA